MSRIESEEKYIQALEDLLSRGQEIGVNSLAESAGLNKVLLYRYFGGLEGLLEQYAKRINLWRSIRVDLEKGLDTGQWETWKEAAFWVFSSYRKRLLQSPVYLRILKEELSRPSVLTRKLEKEREEEGLCISTLIGQRFSDIGEGDMLAAGAFAVSGLTYLILKSTEEPVFNGLDLSKDESWERVDAIWMGIFLQGR